MITIDFLASDGLSTYPMFFAVKSFLFFYIFVFSLLFCLIS